ncbi:MAG: helix-turn-helix domain-containing protein [Planctomycetota bacterium]|nr:helix-turn-helix domain-containing protein [Planctomycetota bacterium]
MTMDELAEYLKISKSTLYKLAKDNKLPGQKIGKRWRFHKDAVDEWVKHGLGTTPCNSGYYAQCIDERKLGNASDIRQH